MSNLRVDELESLATGRTIPVDKIDTGVREDLANPDKGGRSVAFQANALSSSVRDVYSKMAETVSVMDFGAKGDGVTDDYQAFVFAAEYAVSNSATVVFPQPENFYLLSEVVVFEGGADFDILISRSARFKTTGAHQGYPIYPQNPQIPHAQAFIVLEGCTNVSVRGGIFDGSAGSHGAGIKSNRLAGVGVMIRNSDGCWMERCEFYSIGNGSYTWTPPGETASAPKRDVGGFVTQSRRSSILFCKSSLCGYEGFSGRIAIDGLDFIGNSQDDNDGTASHMLQPTNDYGGQFPLPEHNFARNIKILQNNGRGARSDITVHGENVLVHGNTLVDVPLSPIDVRAYSANVVITGNTIVGVSVRGTAAIWLLGGIPDCWVDGNIIVNYDKEYEVSQTIDTHFMGNNILRDVGDSNNNTTRLGLAAGANSYGLNVTAIGRSAGNRVDGAGPTAVGFEALKQSVGNHAVGLGFRAGAESDVNRSIAIGYESGRRINGFENWTVIGSQVNPTASRQFKIGTGQHIEISRIGAASQPGPPSEDELRIYAVIVEGKLTLRAKFSSGQTVDIASDPS